jgi:hypothetical protein
MKIFTHAVNPQKNYHRDACIEAGSRATQEQSPRNEAI